MTDKLFIFDKETYSGVELGNIQSQFNISLVIDGTKDSAKVEVVSFNGDRVEPNTLAWHENTNTWWCVSHDKVTRFMNENSTYYYTHELELNGAIEILNARDLTNCGFNQNTYTIGEVLQRLFKLSQFELSVTINGRNVIDLDKKVDYVKTYENYTLAKAIREFLDAYNCIPKLEFFKPSTSIVYARLLIYSKTGDNDVLIDEDVFNNVDEIKTIDRNSFGTTVVSNAENVISTKTKTFPTTGGIRLSANQYTIEPSNALIRLPSPLFSANWVKMFSPLSLTINWIQDNTPLDETFKVYPSSFMSLNNLKNEIIDKLSIQFSGSALESAIEQLNENWDIIVNKLKLASTTTFYGGNQVNPITGEIVIGNNVPRLPKINIYKTDSDGLLSEQTVALVDEETGANLLYPNTSIQFSRGKDVITNFRFLKKDAYTPNIKLEETDYQDNDTELFAISTVFSVEMPTGYSLYYYDISFQVQYVPMNDIKIKYDNDGTRRDMQLYNQNGKLTDSVGLSKLLLSYAKEIQSDSITKYGTFYDFNNVPREGKLVDINGTPYVINNVSLNMFPNEDGYFINGEFTMSKAVALKSAMVNPNTNIRDYGIPQNNNVKRRQLYRDFYELSHTETLSADTPYLGLDKILNVTSMYKPYQEHIAIMRIEYENAIGDDPKKEWYYQLETTTFIFKKSIYEIVDFKDNNIIGYGSQNVWCGFDITRVFSNQTDDINTPISYVDDNGQFKGIDIAFCNNEQVTEIYNSYQEQQETIHSTTYNGSLFNYSVFIPKEIYEGSVGLYDGARNNNDFMISESELQGYYYKDALEVPVFEYSCQIDDSDNVLIGNNVLDNFENDHSYLYSFYFIEKNRYNDNNYSLLKNDFEHVVIDNGNIASLDNVAIMNIEDNQLNISLKESIEYDLENQEIDTLGQTVSFDTTKDLMIIRHRILESDLLYKNSVGVLYSTNVYNTLPTPSYAYMNKMVVVSDDNYYICTKDIKVNNGTLLTTSTNYYDYTNTYGGSSFPNPQSGNGMDIAVKTRVMPNLQSNNLYRSVNTYKGYKATFSGTTYGWDNLPNTSAVNDNDLIAVKIRDYPSGTVNSSYKLYDRNVYYRDTYTGQNDLPSGITNGYQVIVEERTPTIPVNNIKLYTTNVLNWSDNATWASTYNAQASNQIFISALDNAGTDYARTGGGTIADLSFSFIISSGARLQIFVGKALNDVINGTATPSYTLTQGASPITLTGTQIFSGVIFKMTNVGGSYQSVSITRGAVVGTPDYPSASITMSAYNQGQSVIVANFSGYNQANWQKIFYPATNKHFIYYYNGVQWIRDDNIENMNDLYGNLNGTTTWKVWNTNQHNWQPYTLPYSSTYKYARYNSGWSYANVDSDWFYYPSNTIEPTYSDKYYQWNSSAWQSFTYTYSWKFYVWDYAQTKWLINEPSTTNVYHCNYSSNYNKWNGSQWVETTTFTYSWKDYRSNGVSWSYQRDLSNNDIYSYSNGYVKWVSANETWVDNTTYSWDSGTSADNKVFTYNNEYYKYKANKNSFEKLPNSNDISRQDLMFIVRDLDQANIDNDTLSLFINYYKII